MHDAERDLAFPLFTRVSSTSRIIEWSAESWLDVFFEIRLLQFIEKFLFYKLLPSTVTRSSRRITVLLCAKNGVDQWSINHAPPRNEIGQEEETLQFFL